MSENVLEMPEFVASDGTRAAVAGRLFNFQTGKSTLQEGHRKWLKKKVVPAIMERPNAWIDLYGYASKIGNRQYNLTLSESRAKAVKKYLAEQLARHGKSIEGMVNIDKGFGEDAPDYYAGDTDNEAYWRAAEVIVFGKKPTRVRPPQKKPVPADKFEIRVVGGGSASFLLQADDFIFQIVDIVRQQTAFYFYTGGGLGISIPKLPAVGSLTKAGPPSQFRTTRPVELNQFNSRASLYQDPGATIGPVSVGGTLRLTIKRIHDHTGYVFTRPKIITIKGGSGIQMPGLGSATEGVLAFVAGIFPFTN